MKLIAQQTEAELLHTLSRAQHWKGQTDNPAQRVGYTRLIDAATARLNLLSTHPSTHPSTPLESVDQSVGRSVDKSVDPTHPPTPSKRVDNTPQHKSQHIGQHPARSVDPTVDNPFNEPPKPAPAQHIGQHIDQGVDGSVGRSVEACPIPVDNMVQPTGEVLTKGGIPMWLHITYITVDGERKEKQELKTKAQVTSSVSTYRRRVQASEKKINENGGVGSAPCQTVEALRNRISWLRYWEGAKERLEAAHRAAVAVPVNE